MPLQVDPKDFLAKPFRLETLTDRVRSVLDSET